MEKNKDREAPPIFETVSCSKQYDEKEYRNFLKHQIEEKKKQQEQLKKEQIKDEQEMLKSLNVIEFSLQIENPEYLNEIKRN